MRCLLVLGLLASLAAVLLSGCEPTVKSYSASPSEYQLSGWFHVIIRGGTVVGYVEQHISPEDKNKILRFVYDTHLNKVGFVTPSDFAFRFDEDGNREKLGLYPEPGTAEAALLRVKATVSIVPPSSKEKKPAP